jgi:hypothetical protein
MADTLLSPTEITREATLILHQESQFIRSINREWDDQFGEEGASVRGKKGPTLKIRRPVQVTVRTGNAWSNQDIGEYSQDLTVSTIKGVDWDFLDVDLVLTIDDFAERYLKPAMSRLAAEMEYDALSMYQSVWNQVGTIGTTPAALSVFTDAGKRLNKSLAPRSQRTALINPDAEGSMVDALKGLFHSSSQVEKQYEDGVLGRIAGFDFRMSSLIRNHTVGPLGGTPLVNGASQGISSGWAATTSLITDGWTAAAASRLKKGDIFTIDGVNEVHHETKQTLGTAQKFVVTADVSSDGSGNLTAVISPAIITGGAYQTVTGSPADNAAITVVGTANAVYPVNLTYHKDAFTFVSTNLMVPKGMDMASRSRIENMSLRFLRGFDIQENRRICRFDTLYGYLAVKSELATRVAG